MQEEFSELNETIISKQTIFEGKVFTCEKRIVELPDGRQAFREIVLHNGGAAILPIDDEGNTYLVSQFRSPFESIMLEAPAGKLEKGEDPYDCAVRELREETGFVAKDVISLGKSICSPGYDSEDIYLYLARDLEFVGNKLDDGEFLNVKKMPLSKALEMLDNGEINDGKTEIALLQAARRMNINGI